MSRDAAAFLRSLWGKLSDPTPPEPFLLSATGFGALQINLSCAFMLARHQSHFRSLTRAAFPSARNDAFANVAIIAAGLVTAFIWSSIWPDVIVGLAIAAMNLDAAREFWRLPATSIERPREREVLRFRRRASALIDFEQTAKPRS